MDFDWILTLATVLCATQISATDTNNPPVFSKDMDNLVLSENTPVGEVVYRLEGIDPEGSLVRYGLAGTDRFSVDPESGNVTLVKPLDREVNDTLKFFVSIEDVVENSNPNIVQVPVSVIVLDENDNAPIFKNAPYEADIPEDVAIGTTVISEILVEDKDSLGDTLEVACSSISQVTESCETFKIVTLESSQSYFRGALVLRSELNYNNKQFYQFSFVASDGTLNSTAGVEIRIVDIQNLPPVFVSSMAAVVEEDAPIGSLVLTAQARDGDRALPREIYYDLLNNPHEYFLLDSKSGELRTARPLDREALADPTAPLNLTVRAREIVNGQPLDSPLTSTLATVSITIKDVNDEPPRFNRRDYYVEIPENLPPGTPLPNLDMVVTDTDLGLNSEFTLKLSDISAFPTFSVEPQQATGTTQVSIRLLNTTLDYEDPNQRKFILLVIAEGTSGTPRLSSTATVTVSVLDVNDNAPVFSQPSYSANIRETAPSGAHVITLTATDRDHERFGTDGIVYQLFGNGAELFKVDNRTGVITVANCPTPGTPPCLDFETRPDYFLSYKATDDDGSGQTKVVPLKISLYDANDNPPVFQTSLYRASIDEGATKFDPELQVQARDMDKTSEIRYSLLNSNVSDLFAIDTISGKINIASKDGLYVADAKDNHIILTVVATDGVHEAMCDVNITVRDVNNNAPQFEYENYDAAISEDAPIGTSVTFVQATDRDVGVNAEINYSIQKGAFDAFEVGKKNGVLTVASKLDYDKRNTYHIQIIASDEGVPSLTGTTILTVTIENVNDKLPYFTPHTQRAEVSVDASIGTIIYNLIAVDPDIVSKEQLKFELAEQVITAVDKNGKELSDTNVISQWFLVTNDGWVVVAKPLDRNIAAVVTLPLTVTDTSATSTQTGSGELIITIVDVNHSPPLFRQPSFMERFLEEQPANTSLGTYTATDIDSAISYYALVPPSQYFQINNVTGLIRSTQKIDYETIKQINLTVVAFDSGVPQLSNNATIYVSIVNVNDESPVFEESLYEATLLENSAAGVLALTVNATDNDDGPFGEIRYSLSGEHANLFTIDSMSGDIRVAPNAIIDRENMTDLWLQAIATDNAPLTERRTTSVPVHISVLDENDNAPVFSQRTYKATVSDTISSSSNSPPIPLLRIRAEDADAPQNANVTYNILQQTESGAFFIDAITGILYPAKNLTGGITHHLKVSATDGTFTDVATVDIIVESVNHHSPTWLVPDDSQSTLEVPENTAQANLLVITLNATDPDTGENGRISYFLKDGNSNIHETDEFILDENTGELRTKSFLDRELRDSYQLVLVAKDHGTPASFETIRFLTVILKDANDNKPLFPKDVYEFSIMENQPIGIIIGTVRAVDKDSGENGKIYYHLLDGNQDGAFALDRTQGIIRTNKIFDRETKSDYILTIHASNNPMYNTNQESLNAIEDVTGTEMNLNETMTYRTERERTTVQVEIKILDENDNPPKFEENVYYAGVTSTANVYELIIAVKATDPDYGANGTIEYLIAASNLYKFGSQKSSGSIVPSPFNITQEGLLLTADIMSEYNQDRFVLQIIAQELEPPHRQAKADVYIWVVSGDQQMRVVTSRSCDERVIARFGDEPGITNGTDALRKRLSEAAKVRLVLSAVRRIIRTGASSEHWCEMYFHAVDPRTYEVLAIDGVLETIDSQYDQLKELYKAEGIETVIAASASSKVPESFDPALAALIALLIVLFTGIVTFVVVCSCLKHWVIPPTAPESTKSDSLVRRKILDELSTTDNPLWLENKLRPYEEQELTMNVFGEQNESSNDLPQMDNTYATIQCAPGFGRNDPGSVANGTERDYATLNPAPPPNSMSAHRGSDAAALEAMLGFQGSTFQPPVRPDTPEPPPRPSNHHSNIGSS